ncbi:sensor histidine kinase, partial [Thermodesulfobacteriota bacterium]
MAESPDSSLNQILQGIAELLPPAWQYPEIAFGRLILDGRTYLSSKFKDERHKQTSDVIVNGIRRGVVEVVYSENRAELDEGPFLKEERNLIDAVAREVSLIIGRREAQDEKAKLQDQLRHADRLATIGQLASGVAHELNEPLGNILGFAQLVKKYPGIPEQASGDLDKIVNASLHAREIIKKLMVFARQMPPQKVRTNLNTFIEEGLSFFESRFSNKGIDLVCSLSDDLPEITCDPSQLQQVLINLIVNGIRRGVVEVVYSEN